MYTVNFWKAAFERALKSGLQALVLIWGGDQFDVLQADFKLAASAFLSAAVLSVITSVISAPVGPDKDSPSLTAAK